MVIRYLKFSFAIKHVQSVYLQSIYLALEQIQMKPMFLKFSCPSGSEECCIQAEAHQDVSGPHPAVAGCGDQIGGLWWEVARADRQKEEQEQELCGHHRRGTKTFGRVIKSMASHQIR